MRDDDGYLFIVDRLKDMIVSGGENIASSEVERVLYEHEAVLEVAVVGRPDERWGEVPVAFVVLREGATATADELLERCRAQLAKFKVPKDVTFIDALPRNPSGQGPQARAARRGAQRGDEHRHRVPPAHRRGGRDAGVVVVDLPVGEPLQHLVERHPALQPRQRGARGRSAARSRT